MFCDLYGSALQRNTFYYANGYRAELSVRSEHLFVHDYGRRMSPRRVQSHQRRTRSLPLAHPAKVMALGSIGDPSLERMSSSCNERPSLSTRALNIR